MTMEYQNAININNELMILYAKRLQRPDLLSHKHRVGHGKTNEGDGNQRNDIGYDDQYTLTQWQRS